MNTSDQDHQSLERKPLLEFVADTAACIRFFSRIPVPRLCRFDSPNREPDFSSISRAIPLAGFFVALPAAILGFLLGLTELPPLVVGFLVVGTLALTTGALHEDGLADVADGFFGGSSPESRLDIMKDSRIGAFGTVTLIVCLGLKVCLIAGLLDRFNAGEAMLILLGAESLSRLMIVWKWQDLPSARPGGLGIRFGRPEGKMLGQASIFAAITLIPAAISLSIFSLSLGLLLAAALSHGLGQLAVGKIKGFTGDVLGAIQQLSALGFLVGALITA
ncbi:MAG: adenosylcobinamide-GDP ribazoletransferase [Rhodobacteraceae bacterium]|nr:adenosylcobinamide-GDP ribazoletransferase [Paracoccaceae bacterium]